MSDALPEPPDLKPTDLSQANFTRSRKGLEPAQVRSLLGRAEDALKVWVARDAALQKELEELRRRVEAAEDLDEAKVTEMLGSHTAKIVTAAREAAQEIRSSAQEESDQLLLEARNTAEELAESLRTGAEEAWAAASEAKESAVAEAELLLTEAREEAEQKVASASEAADALVSEAEQAASETERKATEKADELVSSAQARHDDLIAAASSIFDENTAQAEEAAAAIRMEAEKAAETLRATASEELQAARGLAEIEIENARQRGREMLAETKEVRERILQDMALRRRAVKQKMEAARAAHVVMVESIEATTEQLAAALGEARGIDATIDAAADSAAFRVLNDVDSFARKVAEDLDAGTETDETEEAEEAEVAEPAAEEALGEVESGSAADAETADVADADDTADDAAEAADAEDVAETDDAAESESEPDETPTEVGSASVHDIFEKMRESAEAPGDEPEGHPSLDSFEDAEGDAPEPEDASAEGTEDPPKGSEVSVRDVNSEPAEVITLKRSGSAPTTEDGSQISEGGVATLAPPTDWSDEQILDRRDDLLAPAEQLMARALKRLISDEQNEVLDRARRVKRGRPDIDELTSGMNSSTFADALYDAFLLSAVAGSQMWCELTGAEHPEISRSDISPALEAGLEELFENRRVHLRGVLEHMDNSGEDSTALVDRLRASYREMRSTSVPDQAADLAVSGFTEGTVLAAGSDATWRWVPDNGGLPCSDAEDNSLAGALACGAEFPTGDDRPPAHPGCRCILAPET